MMTSRPWASAIESPSRGSGCADRTAARRHEDRRKVQVGATASIRRWLPGKRCILRPRLRGSRPDRDRRPVRRPAPDAVAVRWRSGRPVADEGSRKMACRGRRAFRCAPRRGLLSGLPRRDVGAHRPHDARLVTDSDAAFARMRSLMSDDLKIGMLYQDYSRTFRVNVEA